MELKPRHLTHGLTEALLRARDQRRAYDPEEAKTIAIVYATSERNGELRGRTKWLPHQVK